MPYVRERKDQVPYIYREGAEYWMSCRPRDVLKEEQEKEDDWETDPDCVNYGTERDLRWGTGSQSYAGISTASISSDLSKSIRSNEEYSRIYGCSATSDPYFTLGSTLPDYCGSCIGLRSTETDHQRPSPVTKAWSDQSFISRYSHCDREQVQDDFYYSKYNTAEPQAVPDERHQVASHAAYSVESLSNCTYSVVHTTSSNHSSVGCKSMEDVAQPYVSDARLCQSNRRSLCPERRVSTPVLNEFQSDYQRPESVLSGLDRSSTFSTNAAKKLDKFFRQKLAAMKNCSRPLGGSPDNSNLYENVDDFYEEEKPPSPPKTKPVSSRQKHLHPPEQMAPPGKSPSLERIRMVMNKTHHIQLMQSHFEHQIQRSLKQKEQDMEQELEKEREGERLIALAHSTKKKQQQCNANGEGRSSHSMVRGRGVAERTTPETCKVSEAQGDAWLSEHGRKEIHYVPPEHFAHTTKRQQKAKGYISQKQASPKHRNQSLAGIKGKSPNTEDNMKSRMWTCESYQNMSTSLDPTSEMTAYKHHNDFKESNYRTAGAPQKKRSSNLHIKSSKEKKLEVQRWLENSELDKSPGESFTASQRNHSRPKCLTNKDACNWDCACDTCRALDKRHGKLREAPRKSINSFKSSSMDSVQPALSKESRSWSRVTPVATKHSGYQQPLKKNPSCSDIDMYDIPEGECFCSFCTKRQQQGRQSPKPEPPKKPQKKRSKSMPRHPLVEPSTSLERLARKMQVTDRVKEIAESFERRARRDAEMAAKERIQRRYKEKELEDRLEKGKKAQKGSSHSMRSQCEAPKTNSKQRTGGSHSRHKPEGRHEGKPEMVKDSHHSTWREAREVDMARLYRRSHSSQRHT